MALLMRSRASGATEVPNPTRNRNPCDARQESARDLCSLDPADNGRRGGQVKRKLVSPLVAKRSKSPLQTVAIQCVADELLMPEFRVSPIFWYRKQHLGPMKDDGQTLDTDRFAAMPESGRFRWLRGSRFSGGPLRSAPAIAGLE